MGYGISKEEDRRQNIAAFLILAVLSAGLFVWAEIKTPDCRNSLYVLDESIERYNAGDPEPVETCY